jgi:hypothetical protein
MTEVANPTLGKIEDAIEKFGLDALLLVGLNALFTAVPWLSKWPLGPFIRKMVEFLSEKLFAAIRLVIDLRVIKFINDKNQAAFDRSVVTLKAIARGYGIESEEFKKARENAKANFADFVRFNGA